MDIREFVFRHMQIEGTVTGHITTKRFAPEPAEDVRLRKSEIKNDPECRELCGKFLFEEIFLMGDKDEIARSCYDHAKWRPLAEQFIDTILPSLTFMEDALNFFNDIRKGKYD